MNSYYLTSGDIDGASFAEWWRHMGKPATVIFEGEGAALGVSELKAVVLSVDEFTRWRYRAMTPARWEWFVESLFLTIDDLRAAKARAEMQAKWHRGDLGAENPYSLAHYEEGTRSEQGRKRSAKDLR